jgi:hypothetical protein
MIVYLEDLARIAEIEFSDIVSTFPYHFHNGSQNKVVDSSRFDKGLVEGFRDFMNWVRTKLSEGKK